MRNIYFATFACVLGLSAPPAVAKLKPGVALGDASACPRAIATAEAAARLPPQIMASIALVESGRPDPATGTIQPWPWSVNIDGQSRFFDTKPAAIAAVLSALQGGARSIDIGCMQVNLQSHPQAFASLDEAFDPATNTGYAARFLNALFAEFGAWPRAVAAYHSREAELGNAYLQKVMAVSPAPAAAGPAPLSGTETYTPRYAALLRQARADSTRLETARGGTLPGSPGNDNPQRWTR